MKKFALLILVVVSLGACKKTIEEKAEDLVLTAMTDGKWKVTSFTLNGTDITADFATYRFKYYANRTVDAINNGSVVSTGQWDGDPNAHTTWASFNTSLYPIPLVNGTWNIVNNSWTHVTASQTSVSGETKQMRLDKE